MATPSSSRSWTICINSSSCVSSRPTCLLRASEPPGYVHASSVFAALLLTTLSQDRPLLQWIGEADAYLAELLWLEGRGKYSQGICKCGADGMYRCDDCRDARLYCQACLVAAHVAHPVHRVQQWKTDHFSRVALKSLGLRVQLGHEAGETCLNPVPCWGGDFVLLDVAGTHELHVDYCGCESALPHHLQLLRARWFPATSVNPKTAATFGLLEMFHTLSGQSKVSAFGYYATLSRRTDNTGTSPPKDRYHAFLIMVREWRHLKMMKRAGRANDVGGIKATQLGECAVHCPACPQPGKNIPLLPSHEDPASKSPHSPSWLRRLFLALDANFRLKRKKVSSDEVDPGLNHGYAYMVSERVYKTHLAAYDKELVATLSDHCNNHDAVKLATLKNSAGLAATGVVSVDCARHGMKRPCSTGDLQKGERHVNVDFVFQSSLRQNAPEDILASYDVSCIYDKNIDFRFDKYGWDASDHNIEWAIPKFHINAHREHCRANYNLHFIPFACRYDGESIERLWAEFNAAATSTKEMGPGSRRDTLDDIFAHHNWGKVIMLPGYLLNKIKKGVPERNDQVCAFRDYSESLPADVVAAWRTSVEAWEADRTQPNPFFIKRPAITQAAIKRQLTEEDAEALQAGNAIVLHDKFSASGMIIAGVELEELQRRVKSEVRALAIHATDIQRAKLQERQNVLCRRIDAWTEIQQLYMPGTSTYRLRLLSQVEDCYMPHNIPLLLPSAAVSFIPCAPSILLQEWRLRCAQAFDSLSDLRGHIEMRTHLFKFKNRFARGQRANTRAQTIIKQVDAKIDADAERYRAAYAAVQSLRPRVGSSEWQNHLQPLQQADIRHVTEGDEGESEGRRTISWIWRATAAPPVTGDALGGMDQTLRVEWCKARARAHRWTEEVQLLQEEMRRTIAYHEWAAEWWTGRVDQVHLNRPEYREGANAYARRQASLRESLRDFCVKTWRDVQMWVCFSDPTVDGTVSQLQTSSELAGPSVIEPDE
ncbi:hypothetical protein OH76DRAFT_1538039 [Lentinus brumalis]|uniref:CxC2-like cysteine cluster KDZ transposase-associated domain-containing protein n=1 Tax=Lentinus brumalis TaxID=2498619 RepID=A0A371CWX2_9APHY|nr:hypothetical protein OH76DRAFT_1538039 [Polyporus brumalis]